MTKADLIIAVSDVEASSHWYQTLLGCESIHGGEEFDVLVNKKNEVLLCLHKWGVHDHPTMQNPKIAPGNGLILYLRTGDMSKIRQNADKMKCVIEEEVHMNNNSKYKEFSLRDPDGYYLTISEYHNYTG